MFLAAACALSLAFDPAPFSRSSQAVDVPAAAKEWFEKIRAELPAFDPSKNPGPQGGEYTKHGLAHRFHDARIVAFGANMGSNESMQFAGSFLPESAEGDGPLTLIAPVDAAWAMEVEHALLDKAPLPDAHWSAMQPGPWTSSTARALLEWMHSWNVSVDKNKMHFAGTEYRFTQRAAMAVTEYLGRVDSYGNDRIIQLLAALRQVDPQGRPRYSNMSDDWKDAIQKILPDIETVLDGRKEQYIKDSSEREWNEARRCTRLLIEAEADLRHDPKFVRGVALAANVNDALAKTDSKSRALVLFDVEELPGADVKQEDAWPAALRSAVGKDCLVILGLAGSGEIARGAGNVGLSEIPAPSLESIFASLSKERCLLNLRALPEKGDARDWWQLPRKTRRSALTTGKPGERDLATIALGRDVDVVLWWPTVTALAH